MDQRTEKALMARRLVIGAILRAFHSQDTLTKQELVNACQVVKLDASWFSKLVRAGVIKSTRGRHAIYSLAASNVSIIMNMESYVRAMHDHQVEACNERRRQAKMHDYRREIKRLKAIITAMGGTY